MDLTDFKIRQFLGEYAVDHRNSEMMNFIIEETTAQAQAKGENINLNLILISAARKSIFTRAIDGMRFLQDSGMKLDLIYGMAFSAGSLEIMEYCYQQDPTIVDRYLSRLDDEINILNCMSFPFVLKHATKRDPAKSNEIFVRLVENAHLGFVVKECCEILEISPDEISGALEKAASHGNANMFETLHKMGGELNYQNHACIKAALSQGNRDILHYLEEQHICLEDFSTEKELEGYRQAAWRLKYWEELHGRPPPVSLKWHDPERYHPFSYEFAEACLQKENMSTSKLAWNISVLLHTDRQVALYLQRWGSRDRHPLFSLIHDIEIPEDPFDTAAWGAALLKHGPEMAKMVKFAGHMPRPHDSVLETRLALAPFIYRRAGEMPELARFCATFMAEEENFDKALDLYRAQKSAGFPEKNIPALCIPGERFGMPGARFYQLPPDDMRGLFLGELVGCCQSVGSDGEECAVNGFTSPDAGFYVIEDREGHITGATWAWRGTQGEMVFDSLEYKRAHITPAQWKALLQAVSADLANNTVPHNVSALMVGTGGDTPKDMDFCPAVAAQPAGHNGYEDSRQQYQIWMGHDYAHKLALQGSSGFLPVSGLKPALS